MTLVEQDELKHNVSLDTLAEFFDVIGNASRIRILFALLSGKELSVTKISELTGISQSATSHQLKNLKQANLIANRRDGKTIYYYLADSHIDTILHQAYEHITE